MQRAIVRVLAAVSISLALTITAAAAPTAEDTIKYRNAVMSSMAAHMNALTLIVFDKVDGADYAQSHADAVANASAELDVLFPEISRDGETDALPAIWKNPDEFATAVADAQAAANDLRTAVGGGDRKALMAALAGAGKSCKGCHESYRAEDHDDDSHEH